MSKIGLVLITVTLLSGVLFGYLQKEPVVTKSMVLKKFGMPDPYVMAANGSEAFVYNLDDRKSLWFDFVGDRCLRICLSRYKYGTGTIPANGIASYQTRSSFRNTLAEYQKGRAELLKCTPGLSGIESRSLKKAPLQYSFEQERQIRSNVYCRANSKRNYASVCATTEIRIEDELEEIALTRVGF